MDLFDMTPEGLAELARFQSRGSSALPITPTSKSVHGERLKSDHVSSLPGDQLHLVEGMSKTFEVIKSHPVLILGAQSDVLFPINQQRELAEAIRLGGNKDVIYYELDSPYGHDTFLIDLAGVGGGKCHFIPVRRWEKERLGIDMLMF